MFVFQQLLPTDHEEEGGRNHFDVMLIEKPRPYLTSVDV